MLRQDMVRIRLYNANKLHVRITIEDIFELINISILE